MWRSSGTPLPSEPLPVLPADLFRVWCAGGDVRSWRLVTVCYWVGQVWPQRKWKRPGSEITLVPMSLGSSVSENRKNWIGLIWFFFWKFSSELFSGFYFSLGKDCFVLRKWQTPLWIPRCLGRSGSGLLVPGRNIILPDPALPPAASSEWLWAQVLCRHLWVPVPLCWNTANALRLTPADLFKTPGESYPLTHLCMSSLPICSHVGVFWSL